MTDTEPLTTKSKSDFTTIYGEPDPRAYFRTLRPLDYQIPQRAAAAWAASPAREVMVTTTSEVAMA